MTLSFSVDFLDPFYTGTAVASSDVPYIFGCAIGGHAYAVELSQYQRQTIERFRNPYDQSNEPGEHSLNIEGPWLRSQSRFDHGAGQDFWDQFDSDRARFGTSKGVDMFTNQNRVALLNDTRSIRSSANTNLLLLSTNGFLYVADGQEVYWTADPTVPSPSWTAAHIQGANPSPATVTDLTTDGVTVYAACGTNGVMKTALGAATSTQLSTYTAGIVAYANGRLMATNGADISEVHQDGTTTSSMVHQISSFAWVTIEGAPNGIYAAGNIGDRNEIYFIGLNAATGALAPPTFAASLPKGETINSHGLVFYNGVTVLATSKGIRLAQVTDSNGIAYAPVVTIPGGASCLEPQDRFAWFGWDDYDSVSTGLGRVDLSTFTVGPLIPAYSSDLMATTQGHINGVVSFDIGTELRYFAVEGVGIFAEYPTKVASGQFTTGVVNFSTTEPKAALSIDMRHEPLDGSISVSVTPESGSATTVGTSMASGSLGPNGPIFIPPETAESLVLTFTLTNGSGSGPVLRRWTLRALITPNRYDKFVVPIYLVEQVETLGESSTPRLVDPLEEFLFLKGLESSGTPTILQLGRESLLSYISLVEAPHDNGRSWTSSNDFAAGIYNIHLISLESV